MEASFYNSSSLLVQMNEFERIACSRETLSRRDESLKDAKMLEKRWIYNDKIYRELAREVLMQAICVRIWD